MTLTPELSIIRLNSTTVRLSWVAESASLVSAYNLYRSTTPYFDPTGTPYQVFANPGDTTFDDEVLGHPETNYFYAMRAVLVGAGGTLSSPSNEVGKFEYTLYETTDTDYTWIALPLVDPSLVMASDLANHIENNCDVAVEVIGIEQWNAIGQTLDGYIHIFGWGDFAISTKFPYRVEVDIAGGEPKTAIWVLVGDVPAVANGVYTLYETTGTDYNWIMQPLELSNTVLASTLVAHIEANSSAPLVVVAVEEWNAAAQTLDSYLHSLEFGDFATRFGYPYQVEVDITTGSSVTWPYPTNEGFRIYHVESEDRTYTVPE